MTDTKKLRVLVCGGRDYEDRERVFAVLDYNRAKIGLLIEGGARGADTHACQWAWTRGVPKQTYLAEWAKYGKSAGMRRNWRMLTEGQPDLVVAFPGGVGTAGMVRIAREQGVRVIVIPARDEKPRVRVKAGSSRDAQGVAA